MPRKYAQKRTRPTTHDRLIIDNRTELPMTDILDMCYEVISNGRISNNNKQFAYATTFTGRDHKKHVVYSHLNHKSDKLIVEDYDDAEYRRNAGRARK